MPGVLLQKMAISDPLPVGLSQNSDPSLYLIVSVFNIALPSCSNRTMQSADDVVYEQDILRDPGSIKPWLIYIDYKYQHGTLLEQAFVG